ncbi:unnamed protein product, partial [Allacma fusca]
MRKIWYLTSFGWLCGTVPVKSPFSPYKFQWISLSLLYSLASFIFTLSLNVDLIVVNNINFLGSGKSVNRTGKLSSQILESTISFYPTINFLLIRLNMLYYCPEIVELLWKIEFLWGKISSCGIRLRNLKAFNTYLLALLLLCFLLIYNWTTQEINFHSLIVDSHLETSFRIPSSSGLTYSFFLIGIMFIYCGILFVICFYTIVGIRLLEIYFGFGEILEAQWRISREGDKPPVVQLDQLIESFEMIIQSVNSFNETCGLVTFILIFGHKITIVAHLCGSFGQGMNRLTGTLGSMCLITLICNVGNYIETMVRNVKENVRSAVVNGEARSFSSVK